jgi:hypothetical protein
MTDGPEARYTFGGLATETALLADSLAAELTADLAWRPGDPLEWEETDEDALACWWELDTGFELVPIPFELTGGASSDLARAILAVHVAFPFNEAERNWLHNVPHGPKKGLSYGEVYEHATGEIMVAGIRQSVSGHELMSRWLAWRRQTDEYAEQGSLDAAHEALTGLRAVLLTEHPSQMS